MWQKACAVTLLLTLGLAAPLSALDPGRAIQQYTHAWYQDQLPQNTVVDIVQRRDGSMWFATYGGIARHSGAEFQVIDKRNAHALRSIAITALLVSGPRRQLTPLPPVPTTIPEPEVGGVAVAVPEGVLVGVLVGEGVVVGFTTTVARYAGEMYPAWLLHVTGCQPFAAVPR